MQEFPRARKSVSEAQVARDKIVGGRAPHTQNREKHNRKITYFHRFSGCCARSVCRRRSVGCRECRDPEPRVEHGTWCSGAAQVMRPRVSVVSSSKVTPGNCRRGWSCPPREMLQRSLSLVRSLSPSCSSRAAAATPIHPLNLYLSPLSHCLCTLSAFLQLRPSALARHSARRLFKKSQHPTHKHTPYSKHRVLCARWTRLLRCERTRS